MGLRFRGRLSGLGIAEIVEFRVSMFAFIVFRVHGAIGANTLNRAGCFLAFGGREEGGVAVV